MKEVLVCRGGDKGKSINKVILNILYLERLIERFKRGS